MTSEARSLDRTSTPLFVAGAASPVAAINALFRIDEACSSCLTDAPPIIATLHDDDPAAERLRSPLSNRGRPATIVTPPGRLRLFVPRPGSLILVDLSRRGSRLGKVAYARSLFESEMLFGFTNLDRCHGRDPEIAIGLWRPFALNWARIGRHLGDEGAALTAEIALGITARRYYLTATLNDRITLALCAADPIAAELAGRAILQLRADRHDDDLRTPWETPLIQRAGELGLGVRMPEQIAPSITWGEPGEMPARFTLFMERFGDLLSVTIDPGQCSQTISRQ